MPVIQFVSPIVLARARAGDGCRIAAIVGLSLLLGACASGPSTSLPAPVALVTDIVAGLCDAGADCAQSPAIRAAMPQQPRPRSPTPFAVIVEAGGGPS
jgi:hypothetical protein